MVYSSLQRLVIWQVELNRKYATLKTSKYMLKKGNFSDTVVFFGLFPLPHLCTSHPQELFSRFMPCSLLPCLWFPGIPVPVMLGTWSDNTEPHFPVVYSCG